MARLAGSPLAEALLLAWFDAADGVMMDASNPWEIDEALEDFGFAMGPFEMQDLIGLDLIEQARAARAPDPARRQVPITARALAEGRIGKKGSVGWYRYPGGGGKVVDPLVEDLAREEAYFARHPRRDMTDDEIRDRLLLSLLSEAVASLDTGAATPAEIDAISTATLHFPAAKSGLLAWADSLGAPALLARFKALDLTPPAGMQTRAETGARFTDR